MPELLTEADKQAAINLAINHNLSCRQVEAITGVSKSRVAQLIQEAKSNPERILFRENKADVFEALQEKLINSMDDDTVKGMVSKRGMVDVAILEDKIRLIRGQATSITEVDIRALIASVPVDNPVDNADPNDIA